MEQIEWSNMSWVGFDMDHTLLRYKLHELTNLINSAMTRFLVEHCGFAESALYQPYDPSFYSKGVLTFIHYYS